MAEVWNEKEAVEKEERGVVAVKISSYFKMYEDGRVDRGGCKSVEPSPVASKDVKVGEGGQWARIFLPPPSEYWDNNNNEEGRLRRLPVVLFFHGGGWMFDSPASKCYNDFCYEMAARSRTIWVSASYGLAPEHQIPEAIEDCVNAFQWLMKCSSSSMSSGGGNPWLSSFADLSKVFLCGISAGATLAHHVVLSIRDHPSSLIKPILGLILVHPGFVRYPPSSEELACPTDDLVNWNTFDAIFRFVLPPDCPKSNPFLNPLLTFHAFASAPSSLHYAPSTLVAVADQDILHVLGLEFSHALRDLGRKVDVFVSHGVGHVFNFAEPDSEQAQSLMEKITHFIRQHCAATTTTDACERVLE